MNKIYFFLIVVLLSSCDRAEKKSISKVSFNLPAQQALSIVTPQNLNPNGTINPTALSDINCYGVLVSGPEDFLRQNQCTLAATLAPFDVGFFIGGFSASAAGTSITFDVASGKDRVFRLVGFQVDTSSLTTAGLSAAQVCAQFKTNDVYQNYMSDPYILGQAAGVELLGGATQQVDLAATFNSNLKVGDCKGPDFQSNKNGLPTKLAINIQDIAIGTNAKPLTSGSCVPMKFQLQDSNGFRPDLSANPIITAKLKVNYLGSSIGTFYAPQGVSSDCTVPITNSADLTISFYNTSTNTAFSDALYFFKPNPSATNPILALTDLNNVLTGITRTYVYSNTSSTPTHYGIYDLYNNISTEFTNTALKTSYVRRNECRPASLQFLDSNGVPVSLTTPSVGQQIIINDSASVGGIVFYPNYNDCLNGLNQTEYRTIVLPNMNYISSMVFAYKIVQSSVTNFSFSITNDAGSGGTALIPSGDLTAASNFWSAIN